MFYVKRMWAEGLTPTAASRLWGVPSRRTLAAWGKEALGGGLAVEVPRVSGACKRAKHRQREVKALLGLELDPLAVLHELHLVAARLGDLDEGVSARVAPTRYERGEVHAGLAEGLGGAHDALAALLAHVLDCLDDLHAPCLSPQVYQTVYPTWQGLAICNLYRGMIST